MYLPSGCSSGFNIQDYRLTNSLYELRISAFIFVLVIMNCNRYIKLIFTPGLVAIFLFLQLGVAFGYAPTNAGNARIGKSCAHQGVESKPVSFHHFQNIPLETEFTQMRHKRALAGNIYIHEPFIAFVPFVFILISYQEIYLKDISERSYLRPSLRGPPSIC